MLKGFKKWYKGISLKRKLYFVVGIMALLIIVELVSLWFSINTLSSVRAYVGGEGLWSKAQKDAIYYLRKFGRTMDPKDYKAFQDFLAVPRGDHKTLVELEKPYPSIEVARQGFIEGRNHPDDVDGMLNLFRRFHNISYIAKAIKIWKEADAKLFSLVPVAERIKAETERPEPSRARIDAILKEIDPINSELTVLEDDFSYTLGEGSRWLEGLVLKLLLTIALTVEFTGLILTISVSIAISKGIAAISGVASRVSVADFSQRAKVYAMDEIGHLAMSFNKMVEDLGILTRERNLAEEDLRKQKKLYETLVNAQSEMGEGLVILEGSHIKFTNEAFCEMTGYTMHELLTVRSFEDLIVASEKNHFIDRKEQEKAGGKAPEYAEIRVCKKNGLTFNAEYSLRFVRAENMEQFVIIIRDLTYREKAEAKFKELLESAPDAMIIVDKNGKVNLINAQTELMFGFSREEIIGRGVDLLMPKNFSETLLNGDNINPKLTNNELATLAIRKDLSVFPAEVRLSPLETEDGYFISAAIRDVTEKKKASDKMSDYSKKLERSNKDLEQFAYIVSHDLREPLRTITSYLQLLQSRYRGSMDNEADEFIDFAVGGAKRMDQLIVDILKYSKIGMEAAKKQEVDINLIIETVLSTLNETIKNSGATIIYENMPVIKGNDHYLTQLFQNLIYNALKFRKDTVPPVVVIEALDEPGQWHFSIKDNGIGIKEEYIEKIFRLFQRLHSIGEYPGTGIGLAICKKIVDQVDGKIWAESKFGEGSTFHFIWKK